MNKYIQCPECSETKFPDAHGSYRERSVVRMYIRECFQGDKRRWTPVGYYCKRCHHMFGIPSESGPSKK